MKKEMYLYQESSTTGLYFENDTLYERYIIYPRGVPFKIKAVYVNNKYVKKEMLDIQDDKIICEYYAFRCLDPHIRIYYYVTVSTKETCDSAVDIITNWKYNLSKIENKVDNKPFNEHEKELLKNNKF